MLGIGLSIAGQIRAPGVATALPRLDALVTRFSADDVPGADGAAIQNWTDQIGGVVATQATSAVRPILIKNALNGRAAMRCNGQYMTIPTPGGLKTAIDSANYTVLIAARQRGAGPGGGGVLFGAGTTVNGLLYFANGANIGRFTSGYVPYTATNVLFTCGSAMGSNWASITKGNGFYEQLYCNGLPVATVASTSITTAGQTIAIGARADGALQTNSDIFEILVWNTMLTPREYAQAEMWLRERYAQPYPWAGVSEILVGDGDSIVAGFGTTAPTNTPIYRVAQSLGLSYGTWMVNAVGGMHAQNMALIAPNRVDFVPQLLGKKTHVVAMCWANGGIDQKRTPAQIRDDLIAYFAGRKAANPGMVRCTAVSSIDYDTTRPLYAGATDRATFNGLMDAYFAGAPATLNGYAPVHNNSAIGAVGAYAATPANWVSDGLHQSNDGAAIFAPLLTSAIQAAAP